MPRLKHRLGAGIAVATLCSAISVAVPTDASAFPVGPCTCRKCHPRRSSRTFVFAENSAETVTSVDVQVSELVRIGDRLG